MSSKTRSFRRKKAASPARGDDVAAVLARSRTEWIGFLRVLQGPGKRAGGKIRRKQ